MHLSPSVSNGLAEE